MRPAARPEVTIPPQYAPDMLVLPQYAPEVSMWAAEVAARLGEVPIRP